MGRHQGSLTHLAGPGVMGSSGSLENENSFTIKLYIMPLQTFASPQQEIMAFHRTVFPRLQAKGYL